MLDKGMPFVSPTVAALSSGGYAKLLKLPSKFECTLLEA
jgi:hypothetical protein